MSDLDVWVAIGHGETRPGYLLPVPKFADFATFASHKSVEHWPRWVVTNLETGYKVGEPKQTRAQAEKQAAAILARKRRDNVRRAMLKAEAENVRNNR